MRYGSVCSGIEAATVAWHPLGWEPVWFSEIEPFPCKLLNYYYPAVPNLGDMLKLRFNKTFQDESIDLLVGGTPCQSFSTAGLRAGLADSRGNLALEFCRILADKRPRWFVWENVPGVFSSGEGEDFGSILRGFSECGYSVSWRVLDAQFFGVPQRRRRVFVVGHIGGDWRPPATVLFEPQSMRRDIKKGRKAGKGTSASLTGRAYADNASRENNLITGTIQASYGRLQGASGQDGGHGHSTLVCPINTQVGLREHKEGDRTGLGIGDIGDPSFTLGKAHHHAVAFQSSQSGERIVEKHGTLKSGSRPAHNGIVEGTIVRRLTPLECERLQGFRDGYTAIPGAADSPRYESIGNSMATKVMAWIGRRIDHVDTQMKNL